MKPLMRHIGGPQINIAMLQIASKNSRDERFDARLLDWSAQDRVASSIQNTAYSSRLDGKIKWIKLFRQQRQQLAS
jgi:hypothetical protein